MLEAALALEFAHYKCCRAHRTLRITPATLAGLSSRPWSVCDLLERCVWRIDRVRSARVAAPGRWLQQQEERRDHVDEKEDIAGHPGGSRSAICTGLVDPRTSGPATVPRQCRYVTIL